MNGDESNPVLQVQLPSDLMGRIGRMAAETGLPPTALVRFAIVSGLDRLETEQAGMTISIPPPRSEEMRA